MASQLTERDKQLLDGNNLVRVGDYAYENGFWGNETTRDFVHFQIFDTNLNLIQYDNLPLSEFFVNNPNKTVDLYPGKHIRNLGFESGTFIVRYNFLRKLAGDESSVLVRTVDRNDTKIGDLYQNVENVFITEEGIIYSGTEEEFRADPASLEELRIEDLKYQIDEVSPSRTEVRLKAKQINSSYIDDFVNIQTTIKTIETDTDISFDTQTLDIFNSQQLQIVQNDNFKFEPKMKDGTVIIPGVYKVNEIQVAVKTDTNLIKNPSAEQLEIDNLGNVVNIATRHAWDETLHDDAVQPTDWSSGFFTYGGATHASIGYHAKWVQNEGRNGGTCVKFSDTNELFTTLDDWNYFDSSDNPNPYRKLGVFQKLPSLVSQGVKTFDIANLRADVKSTVSNKGIKFNLYYPYELNIETKPSDNNPPAGYFNPDNISHEPIPEDDPPGWISTYADLEVLATEKENKPPTFLLDIQTAYPQTLTYGFKTKYQITSANATGQGGANAASQATAQGSTQTNYKDPVVGDTTLNTTIGGEGAWKISSIDVEQQSTGGTFSGDGEAGVTTATFYHWEANETMLNLPDAEGALSTEGQWVFRTSDGTWQKHPDFADTPTPPDSSTYVENAVNYHPYQHTGQGMPHFYRKTYPGQNRGWQTGTVTFSTNKENGGTDKRLSNDQDGGKMGIYGDTDGFMLLKDDLVWWLGDTNASDNNEIVMFRIEKLFPSLITQTISYLNEQNVNITHSVYQDIFERGFIQSITKTKAIGETGAGDGDRAEENVFVLFYNDGRGTELSNKTMMVSIRRSNFTKSIRFLKDLDSNFNQTLINSGNQMEWAFQGEKKSGGSWEHVVVVKGTNKIWNFFDSKGDFYNEGGDRGSFFADGSGATNSFIDRFNINFQETRYFDVWFSEYAMDNHWSNWAGIVDSDSPTGGRFFNFNTNDTTTTSDKYAVNEWAYNAGVIGTYGAELTYGVRNPSAINAGAFDGERGDGDLLAEWINPFEIGGSYQNRTNTGTTNNIDSIVYDNGKTILSYDNSDPRKRGKTSKFGQYEWNGSQWVQTNKQPGFLYKGIYPQLIPTEVGKWETLNVEVTIPDDWMVGEQWYLYIYGNDAGSTQLARTTQGIVWADNLYLDFTLVDESITQPVSRPYMSKISNVLSGQTITVEKSINAYAGEIGAIDGDDEDTNPDIFNLLQSEGLDTEYFDKFKVSFLNLNPKDLRTYLKFGNDLFLTTNFKQDKVNVSNYPHGVVYKLYEPLPDNYVKFDECIIVKEMMNPLQETINIIDFVPEEEPQLVLKTPDMYNVESPVNSKSTEYKSESDILTTDSTISNELKNEFLSQSLDSVEINTDYSNFKNFINFSSAEQRIENFKSKIVNIESYKVSSASFIGVSGSLRDLKIYHHQILDTQNKFDSFEKYMYFKSSSYTTSSLGEFYDNAWPKTGGDGSLGNKYTLAASDSSQAKTWLNTTLASASLYDQENNSKLSDALPEHIKFDVQNQEYLKFTDMIGQHFDSIWEYINAL